MLFENTVCERDADPDHPADQRGEEVGPDLLHQVDRVLAHLCTACSFCSGNHSYRLL